MKKLIMILSLALLTMSAQAGKPWDNGKLKVSDNQRYLQFENGQPFFWLGETGWLLPERLDRAEAEWYLQSCAKAGYNVVQVQTIDGVPAYVCSPSHQQASKPHASQPAPWPSPPPTAPPFHMSAVINALPSTALLS